MFFVVGAKEASMMSCTSRLRNPRSPWGWMLVLVLQKDESGGSFLPVNGKDNQLDYYGSQGCVLPTD